MKEDVLDAYISTSLGRIRQADRPARVRVRVRVEVS